MEEPRASIPLDYRFFHLSFLPVKCWKGEFGAMWIEYESGNCWQYRETASGLEWY